MKKNNLENKIKDSLDGYEFHLDHDEIWQNIEPELKKKKKRRFFFIWFLGSAMLLGVLLKYVNMDTGGTSILVEKVITEKDIKEVSVLPNHEDEIE